MSAVRAGVDNWFVSDEHAIPDRMIPTFQFRWRRPKGGTDNDKVLEQCFVNMMGLPTREEWREIPTFLED